MIFAILADYGDEHDLGALKAMKELHSRGSRVVLGPPGFGPDQLAGLALKENASAVFISMMGSNYVKVVEGVSDKLKVQGLKVPIVCGGYFGSDVAVRLEGKAMVFGNGLTWNDASHLVNRSYLVNRSDRQNWIRQDSGTNLRVSPPAAVSTISPFAQTFAKTTVPSIGASQASPAFNTASNAISNAVSYRISPDASTDEKARTGLLDGAIGSSKAIAVAEDAARTYGPLGAQMFLHYSVQSSDIKALRGFAPISIAAQSTMPQLSASSPALATSPATVFVQYSRNDAAARGHTRVARLVYVIGNDGALSVASGISPTEASQNAQHAILGSANLARSVALEKSRHRKWMTYDRERTGDIVMAGQRTAPQSLPIGKAIGFVASAEESPASRSEKLVPQSMITIHGDCAHESYATILRKGSAISRGASPLTEDKKISHLNFEGKTQRKPALSGGGPGPSHSTRETPASAHSASGEIERAARRGNSMIGRLILALLGLLGKTAKAFGRFDASLKDRYTERLLLKSDRFREMLEKEAAVFGIDLHGSGATDYYGVLGIKYTTDQKEIKRAYKELVKKHHPDVSKEIDAGQIMQKINEAYATLNSGQKHEYDKTFSSGKIGVRADDAKRISDELLGRYMKAREADFEKFRKATSAPMTADQLTAAMDEVCAWGRRFDRVAGGTFKKFIKYGRSVRKLSAANKRLIGKTTDAEVLLRLRKNADQLEELTRAYDGIEHSLSGIRKGLKKEIGSQESEVARKLRASVKY